MKVTYEFLADEHHERQVFDSAHKFYSALWEISDRLRQYEKYDIGTPDEVFDGIRKAIADSGMWEIE